MYQLKSCLRVEASRGPEFIKRYRTSPHAGHCGETSGSERLPCSIDRLDLVGFAQTHTWDTYPFASTAHLNGQFMCSGAFWVGKLSTLMRGGADDDATGSYGLSLYSYLIAPLSLWV